MAVLKSFVILLLVSSVWSSPVSSDKEENHTDFEDDPFGYVEDSLTEFIDDFLSHDNYQVSEDVEVNRNDVKVDETEARSLDFGTKIEKYIKTHDVTVKVPFVGEIKVDTKNLENDELTLNVNYGNNNVDQARKSKMKKILTPILVFFLLKAITIVPLAIGILLLKAWNSLQLSAIAFVISAGLAIFQLCKKIAENNAHAQISAKWDEQALQKHARSFGVEENAQNLAYSAHRQ